jgi:hypothetical protein
MKRRLSVTLLGCLLACGCSQPTAPTSSYMAGTWRLTFSMSANVASDTFTCSGQLDLSLTQTDTVLSGTFAALATTYPNNPTYCRLMSASSDTIDGWDWGFLAPYAVAGVARASGEFRLGVMVIPSDNPQSLALIGHVTAGSGAGSASSALMVVYSASGARAYVPLTGTFVLHPGRLPANE